jgi:hypothetical protein
MTINLNKTKEFVTKELLFKYITDYDVFAKYITDQQIVCGRNIYSPLRKREENPSFGFFLGEGNELCFHDFTLKLRGDCVKFVMVLFNLTHFEALSKIATDFDMENDFIVKKFDKGISKSTVNTCKDKALENVVYKYPLGKRRRNWNNNDLKYWAQFGISLSTLKRYNVEPISHVFVNGTPITTDDYSYCFIEHKDGIETYKIYQPFNKDYKWLSSHDDSVWQGWSQLPTYGETLVITKSLKDVMSLYEVLDVFAVSLQAEGVSPKPDIMRNLIRSFKNVIILYDNDYDKETNWGQLWARKLADEYFLHNVCIHRGYESKDFSDLVKNVGVAEAQKIGLHLLYEGIYF